MKRLFPLIMAAVLAAVIGAPTQGFGATPAGCPAPAQGVTWSAQCWATFISSPEGFTPLAVGANASGDLGGTYPGPTVTGIQGVPVSNTAPTNAQVLTFDGTTWGAANSAGGSPTGSAGGDLSGTYPNPTVAKLNGTTPGGSCPAHEWASSISTSGVPSCTQPATGDVTGLGTLATINSPVPVANGGTGQTSAGTAAANAIGAAEEGANTSITSLAGLTTPLSQGQGGTGATTVSGALDTLFGNSQGTVAYRGASGWAGLAPGTSGQRLTTSGASANPSWQTTPLGPGYVSGVFYTQPISGIASSAAISAANTIYGSPFYATQSQTWTKMSVDVTTLAAGASCELGVYNNNAGQPGSLLIDAGNVSVAATGVQTISSLTIPMLQGWYWLAVLCNGTPSFEGFTPGSGGALIASFIGVAAMTTPATNYQASQTYGALPGTFPSPGLSTNPQPLIGLRF